MRLGTIAATCCAKVSYSIYYNESPMNKNIDISKYLQFLDDDGWSELIDSRWKDEVKQTLTSHFPDMTEEEWDVLVDVSFV